MWYALHGKPGSLKSSPGHDSMQTESQVQHRKMVARSILDEHIVTAHMDLTLLGSSHEAQCVQRELKLRRAARITRASTEWKARFLQNCICMFCNVRLGTVNVVVDQLPGEGGRDATHLPRMMLLTSLVTPYQVKCTEIILSSAEHCLVPPFRLCAWHPCEADVLIHYSCDSKMTLL